MYKTDAAMPEKEKSDPLPSSMPDNAGNSNTLPPTPMPNHHCTMPMLLFTPTPITVLYTAPPSIRTPGTPPNIGNSNEAAMALFGKNHVLLNLAALLKA
jgi:hypothetical protein